MSYEENQDISIGPDGSAIVNGKKEKLAKVKTESAVEPAAAKPAKVEFQATPLPDGVQSITRRYEVFTNIPLPGMDHFFTKSLEGERLEGLMKAMAADDQFAAKVLVFVIDHETKGSFKLVRASA